MYIYIYTYIYKYICCFLHHLGPPQNTLVGGLLKAPSAHRLYADGFVTGQPVTHEKKSGRLSEHGYNYPSCHS